MNDEGVEIFIALLVRVSHDTVQNVNKGGGFGHPLQRGLKTK